ncbi:hypothetical protein TRFO_42895 [Tritrichomonas foetus]|uniref:Right handed beta helix domain-containing protein n=1 Tax=Tritrichomonas foetus TaxID=1144522 RepID=A0A1J4KV72_9EUKA|nr:hypothetical protein TRFO_42895 [Tritrichomonas foetus]|eukprot:OHT14792.1 hypothetical protein TRFO_42895 [Tritrichomonas foetus]
MLILLLCLKLLNNKQIKEMCTFADGHKSEKYEIISSCEVTNNEYSSGYSPLFFTTWVPESINIQIIDVKFSSIRGGNQKCIIDICGENVAEETILNIDIQNCEFQENTMTGLILHGENTILNAQNCKFLHNDMTYSSTDQESCIGAVYSFISCTVKNCTFDQNFFLYGHLLISGQGDAFLENLNFSNQIRSHELSISNAKNATIKDCTFCPTIDEANIVIGLASVEGGCIINNCTFLINNIDEASIGYHISIYQTNVTFTEVNIFQTFNSECQKVWKISRQEYVNTGEIQEYNDACSSTQSSIPDTPSISPTFSLSLSQSIEPTFPPTSVETQAITDIEPSTDVESIKPSTDEESIKPSIVPDPNHTLPIYEIHNNCADKNDYCLTPDIIPIIDLNKLEKLNSTFYFKVFVLMKDSQILNLSNLNQGNNVNITGIGQSQSKIYFDAQSNGANIGFLYFEKIEIFPVNYTIFCENLTLMSGVTIANGEKINLPSEKNFIINELGYIPSFTIADFTNITILTKFTNFILITEEYVMLSETTISEEFYYLPKGNGHIFLMTHAEYIHLQIDKSCRILNIIPHGKNTTIDSLASHKDEKFRLKIPSLDQIVYLKYPYKHIPLEIDDSCGSLYLEVHNSTKEDHLQDNINISSLTIMDEFNIFIPSDSQSLSINVLTLKVGIYVKCSLNVLHTDQLANDIILSTKTIIVEDNTNGFIMNKNLVSENITINENSFLHFDLTPLFIDNIQIDIIYGDAFHQKSPIITFEGQLEISSVYFHLSPGSHFSTENTKTKIKIIKMSEKQCKQSKLVDELSIYEKDYLDNFIIAKIISENNKSWKYIVIIVVSAIGGVVLVVCLIIVGVYLKRKRPKEWKPIFDSDVSPNPLVHEQ